MKLLIALLLLSFSVGAVDYPPSWPRSLDEIETSYTPNRFTIVWPTNRGTFYCGSGTIPQVASIAARLMRPFSDESFISSDYLTRNQDRIFTRDLNEAGITACNILITKLSGTWIVDQYRSNPTRPVYVIMDNFPSIKVKAGNVNHGVTCGKKVAPYSAKIKKYEWREITLSNGLIGASVCRKQ